MFLDTCDHTEPRGTNNIIRTVTSNKLEALIKCLPAKAWPVLNGVTIEFYKSFK